MIVHIKSKDSKMYQFNNTPDTWRKDWSKEHLDNLIIALDQGKLIGRVGVYINPHFEKEGIAFLGAFEVIDDYKVTESLLTAAVDYLKNKGIHQIIGPMDGSTWNNYRFREAGQKQTFFMEPNQEKWYPEHWRKFGFSACQEYLSNRMALNDLDINFLKSNQSDITNQGIQLRHFDPTKAERELELLADFNQEVFQNNFLYSPFSKEQFVKKYKPLVPYLDPELILFAEDKNGLAGLIFTVPDHNDQSGKSAVLKTLARKPGKEYAGLGRYLVHYLIQKTKEKGFQYLIHALMHIDNASLSLSKKLKAEVYSRYSLLQYT